MKLRNKKTGEIAKLVDYVKANDRMFFRFEGDKGTYKKEYNSLAELNDEWEDYEEPKEYWFIDFNGEIKEFEVLGFEWQGWMKEIGNYFGTREEAEKAVEKLKAFKRLQDLGFKFEGVRFRNNHSYIEWKIEPKNELTDDEAGKLMEDLYEVFGGKDESNQ